MKLPGFTAESSLYEYGERYQQQSVNFADSTIRVVPAWWHCFVVVDSADGSGWINCHWHPEEE